MPPTKSSILTHTHCPLTVNNVCGCNWDGGDCCGPNVKKPYCKECKVRCIHACSHRTPTRCSRVIHKKYSPSIVSRSAWTQTLVSSNAMASVGHQNSAGTCFVTTTTTTAGVTGMVAPAVGPKPKRTTAKSASVSTRRHKRFLCVGLRFINLLPTLQCSISFVEYLRSMMLSISPRFQKTAYI